MWIYLYNIGILCVVIYFYLYLAEIKYNTLLFFSFVPILKEKGLHGFYI